MRLSSSRSQLLRTVASSGSSFGRVMKEGPAEDHANSKRIAGLLRFATTKSAGDVEDVSLETYVGRMAEGQDKIYYITAETPAAAKNSPHLEIFRKRDIEVLLLSDRVDEWLVAHLTEFDGKPLQSVAKGAIDLDSTEDAGEGEDQAAEDSAHKELLERLKNALDGVAKDVRVSHRLVESPACLVVDDYEMSQNLARVLKQLGQEAPKSQPILEVNTTHPLVDRLAEEADEARFGDLAHLLFDQAQLAEGGQLDDPAAFVQRLNQLLAALFKAA